MRGERTIEDRGRARVIGSSPHARGTPVDARSRSCSRRFIPACAGNAARRHPVRPRRPVHPRMRGERAELNQKLGHAAGSSPHARGTHSMDASVDRHHRFIPACAGNAREQCRRGRLRSVHPRMRGERALTIGGAVLAAGSSPHARGTRLRRDRAALVARFIPACAGNARRTACCPGSEPVHPRMRGERRAERGRTGSLGGSSPHARGTHDFRSGSLVSTRFIPACAGNACPSAWTRRGRPVHPRMRGERPRAPGSRVPPDGSSPHARGTLIDIELEPTPVRFIPACAGNAQATNQCPHCRAVHPRMRGERTSNKLLIYRRKSEPSDSTKHSGC